MHSLQQQQQQHLLLRKSTVRFAKLFRWALSFHCHSRQSARATRLQRPDLFPSTQSQWQLPQELVPVLPILHPRLVAALHWALKNSPKSRWALRRRFVTCPPTHPVVRSECGLLLTQMAVARLTALSYEVWMLRTPSGVWRGRGAVTPCASLTHPLTRPDASPGQGP